MDNIEQLKQENTKLTERLNNAAKFFREQKAQIESLTKENEQLKNDNNVKDDSIRLNNELLETVENLTKENEELKHDSESFNSLQENYEKQIKELQDKINSLEFNEESDANVINNYAEEIEKYKKNVDLYQKSIQEFNIQIDELNKTIDSKDKAYKVLQDTYNEVFGENTKLKDKINTQDKEYQFAIAKYDEQIKHVEKLTSDIAKVESDNDLLRKNIEGKDKLIEEQKNEISNLNVTLDDIENSKLAIECDFNNLEEKFKQIELDMINKDEIIKSYKEELFNENICKYNKKDINDLCDQLLDFFRDKQLNGGE